MTRKYGALHTDTGQRGMLSGMWQAIPGDSQKDTYGECHMYFFLFFCFFFAFFCFFLLFFDFFCFFCFFCFFAFCFLPSFLEPRLKCSLLIPVFVNRVDDFRATGTDLLKLRFRNKFRGQSRSVTENNFIQISDRITVFQG